MEREGVNAVGARVDNLTTFMCQMCRNSDSLNLLEPYGPFQAGNEIVFSLVRKFNFRFPVAFYRIAKQHVPAVDPAVYCYHY